MVVSLEAVVCTIAYIVELVGVNAFNEVNLYESAESSFNGLLSSLFLVGVVFKV